MATLVEHPDRQPTENCDPNIAEVPGQPGMAARPDFPSPQCPQFRAGCQRRGYPGTGYCIREGPAGHLMIPSTEEFRTLCTMPHFRHCPWFGAPQTPGALRAMPWDQPDPPRDDKEVAGELIDDPNLEAEGASEKIAGKAQKKVGEVKDAFEK